MKSFLFLLFSLFFLQLKASAQLNWQTFNVPGASSTWIDGIDGNTIVGSFEENGILKGFSYNRLSETWSILQAPGYDWTLPLAISGNTIVGSVGLHTPYSRNGFTLQNNSTWSFLNSPDHGTELEAKGVDGSYIVGGTAIGLGFISDGNSWSYYNSPFGERTSFEGISGSTIVGTYFNTSDYLTRGFIKNDSSWTLLDVAEAVETLPRDIDGNHIVGQYRMADSEPTPTYRSFFYDGTSLIYLDAPSAESTYAWGIDGNTIVGSFNDSTGVSQGFILTVPEPSALSLLAVGLGGLAMMRRRWS